MKRKKFKWTPKQRKALKATLAKLPRVKDARLKALQIAVGKYLECVDGMAIVIGGVEIMTFPEDSEMNFRVALRVTGRRPIKPTPI